MMRVALGVWILTALICLGRGDHHFGHALGDQDTAVDSSTNRGYLVTASNKEFAYRFYKKLAAHSVSQGKNVFFSPSSVSVALAALSVGARGATRQQLFTGLGYDSNLLTQPDVDRAFQALLSNRTSSDTSEGTAVFVHNQFKPRPEFLHTLKSHYLADGFDVDFTNAESANTINRYVAEKTNGKIDRLVENLDPNTVMYLISYIYYKGKWATPFDTKLTKEDTFNVDENTKVQVQMMNMDDRVDTYYDQTINTSVLHLPFNTSYSMLLMLPDDMATLENAICPAHVTKWLRWMKTRKYDIYLPKFSIKSSYKLNDVLTEMGMTDMFGDSADLSGIADGQKLAVSEVVHQATLDVDEAGATAAAATGIGITLMSLQYTPVLKFNRPFMVVIIDRITEDILFMGKIINPNI